MSLGYSTQATKEIQCLIACLHLRGLTENGRVWGLGFRVVVRWTPTPINSDYKGKPIKVLLHSYHTTIAGWGGLPKIVAPRSQVVARVLKSVNITPRSRVVAVGINMTH